MPRYRFKYSAHPHGKGDPVPDSYPPGMIQTMLAYGRIEPVPEPEAHAPVEDPAKAITVPAEDKMVRPAPRIKRKGVGA